MNHKKRNPFWIPFFGCTLISCIILSFAFLYVLNDRSREMEGKYYQEKTENILDDFDFQMKIFGKIALRVAINNKYQPFQLSKQKYNENELLDDFTQYQQYSVLTNELFLYYHNNNNIFHVMGNTINKDVYLDMYAAGDEQKVVERLEGLGVEQDVLLAGERIYILTPVNIYDRSEKVKVVLAGVVEEDALRDRFEMISGGLDGSIALYKDGELFYYAGEEIDRDMKKGVYSAADMEKGIRLYYRPDKKSFFSLERFSLQVLLVLSDILLVMVIAGLFARKAYKPILKISEKYQGDEMLPDMLHSDNALEEIDNILDLALKKCVVTAQRLEQQQELLKRQVLRMLLNGTYLQDIQKYLEKLNIVIPGPFFCVISIFLSDDSVNDEFMLMLQKELEELTAPDDEEYFNVVCDFEQKQLWTICSFVDDGKEREIIEYVKETVGSFTEGLHVGIGRVYGSLSKISASWLESIDNLSDQLSLKDSDQQSFTYTAESVQCILDALSKGAEGEALQELGNYTAYLKKNHLSLLMRQYIFTEFIGEISRLSKKCRVELSNQSLSLIMSSKSIDSFYEAAHVLICEFCSNYASVIEDKLKEGTLLICRYIEEHCTEYDLSIEKVAQELEMTNTIVRKAVQNATGNSFRNYVVFLRVEYAKRLLTEEKLPVNEVGKMVGYSSVSHFIKIFKNVTGKTPAKYVKENEEG